MTGAFESNRRLARTLAAILVLIFGPLVAMSAAGGLTVWQALDANRSSRVVLDGAEVALPARQPLLVLVPPETRGPTVCRVLPREGRAENLRSLAPEAPRGGAGSGSVHEGGHGGGESSRTEDSRSEEALPALEFSLSEPTEVRITCGLEGRNRALFILAKTDAARAALQLGIGGAAALGLFATGVVLLVRARRDTPGSRAD